MKIFIRLIFVTIFIFLSACGFDQTAYYTPNTINNPNINGGKVLIFTTDGTYVDTANIGYHPDMVKFVDSSTIIVANEGTPEDDYASDPEGSISIITLASESTVEDVTTLGFGSIALNNDVRIKPDSTATTDIEPEYIAINQAGTTAWVTLQENNAYAVVDIQNKTISQINGFGKKELNTLKIDIVDDGVATPTTGTIDNIFALYQADAIASYSVNGDDYYITANEGSDREYGSYEDQSKANDLVDSNDNTLLSSDMDDILTVNSKDSKKLRVFNDLGKDLNGIYTSLYIAGTRSFSIWNASGIQVYDSASDFEEHLAAHYPTYFNIRVDNTDKASDISDMDTAGTPYTLVGDKAYFWDDIDAQSLKKGAKPSSLAIHTIANKTFAYIGLEKQGGFFIYDITDPSSPIKVSYFNDIDYSIAPGLNDLGPESMVAFEQDNRHYLAVAYKLSATVAIYDLANNGTASKLGSSINLGSFDQGAAGFVDYDNNSKTLFLSNNDSLSVDIVNISIPNTPSKLSINLSSLTTKVRSVSVIQGLIAVAVE
ncbi:MAG: hypothetical protein ISR69_14400 [Gammaproteobacteria bacterium]|nr:hypothetical protein [Gammaproteobacteria bacterium]